MKQRFGAPRDDPPSDWAHATSAGHDVFYLVTGVLAAGGKAQDVIVWHWCARDTKPQPDDVPRWSAARCSLHTVLSVEPLTLDPSLACADCSNHGHLRAGEWQPV